MFGFIKRHRLMKRELLILERQIQSMTDSVFSAQEFMETFRNSVSRTFDEYEKLTSEITVVHQRLRKWKYIIDEV